MTYYRDIRGSVVIVVEDGDVPGHEFHGNQWSGGKGKTEKIIAHPDFLHTGIQDIHAWGAKTPYKDVCKVADTLSAKAESLSRLASTKEEHAAAYGANMEAYAAHQAAVTSAQWHPNTNHPPDASELQGHINAGSIYSQRAEEHQDARPGTQIPLDQKDAETYSREFLEKAKADFGTWEDPKSGGAASSGPHFERFSELDHKCNNVQEATKFYTNGAGSTIMNQGLRGGDKMKQEFTKGAIEHMDAAIAASPLPKDTTLYRGISDKGSKELFHGEPKVGDVVKDKGYASTSKDEKVARGTIFLRRGGTPTVMRISAPKGTPALDMDKVIKSGGGSKGYVNEKEMVLPRSSSFKITKVYMDDDGVRVVHAQVQK